MMILIALILMLFMKESQQGREEKRLLNTLFADGAYNKLERPVADDKEPLIVNFSLTLQQIIDVDEKNQIIHTNLWLNIKWNDYNLVWNPQEYDNISSLRISANHIWRPDILMYNSADEDIDSTFPTNIVVSSNGNCLWVPPGMFASTCKIDISWFPFDDQRCKMKFGSWTYDSSGINLILQNDTGDVSNFIPSGEWDLIGMPASRNVLSYDCCPEQYIDITFVIHIRRRFLYYAFNLIIPCILISSMALLTFTLPPDAGEKISLGVTVLLSLTVFLLLVAETMPPTADAVPLIGSYFAGIMLMCSLSVVCTVLVLNFHHRSPDTHGMPNWVRIGVCQWLAKVVRMKRPNFEEKKHDRAVYYKNTSGKERHILENNKTNLKENILLTNKLYSQRKTPISARFSPTTVRKTTLLQHESIQFLATTKSEQLLLSILNELKFATNKIRNDDMRCDMCNDWKFAAMVVDRLCLWLFTVFTLGSTAIVFLSAPHVVKYD
ncbi:hypothetical protein HELRODRAFT_108613 [Helobdella robusta]|uniref:Uncharacterized protein n=1 Tax=Helobdella robusta TaxID=6412 RepID=T1EEK9_HELRO|nr:hypothetical protein HELRODRAFT_108613 [Helobdella robusta]ESN90492.1 hypothetical protein HELRODRAFT_108613 [Helobdella robusta]